MKTIIFGAKGQLGGDLADVLRGAETIALDYDEVDISNSNSVSRTFEKYKPDAAINVAAMTDVPGCERDDVKAFMVNGLGPKFIAENCLKSNALLLHISTDYVFDGKKNSPYIEDDPPNPLNVYGISKLAGEYYIRALMERYFIVRTSGLYGLHKCIGKGGNFVDSMLRLSKEQKEIKVIDDEILTPTYTLDLANQIKDLIKTNSYGIYHITNEGFCSWYEFAEEIFRFLDIKVNSVKISHSEFPSIVKRPRYSVLENKRLKLLGINKMRDWKDALHSYLIQRKKLNLV
ncbi:MAG: dTDP-4-dehydrorhamnose reductase [Candidatus Omnitrophota bacterium]|nr:dTDP-4-dehydrorhamnose reductase [Candidatus Omnitrophota bacterium]